MASPKRLALPTQGGESTWDSSHFTSQTAWHIYQDNIHLQNILPERNVELAVGMFDEFLESSNGGSGTGYSPNTRKNGLTSLWSNNFTQTSIIERTTLQNTERCGGLSSGSMHRPLMISLTPHRPCWRRWIFGVLPIPAHVPRSPGHHGNMMHTQRRIHPEHWWSLMEAITEGSHYTRPDVECTFLF